MINIVTAVSKYVFILLGAVFCLHGFLGHVFYKKRREQGKQRKGIIQIIIVICMTVLGNVILFMNSLIPSLYRALRMTSWQNNLLFSKHVNL